MSLSEGKNREIKRVLEHLVLDVTRLIRISYGPFQLGDIAEGAVEEVKLKVLRDQLGKGLAELAGVDFRLRLRETPSATEAQEARVRAEGRPRKHVSALRKQRDKGAEQAPRARSSARSPPTARAAPWRWSASSSKARSPSPTAATHAVSTRCARDAAPESDGTGEGAARARFRAARARPNSRKRARHAAKARRERNSNAVRTPASQGRLSEGGDGSSGQTRAPRALRQGERTAPRDRRTARKPTPRPRFDAREGRAREAARRGPKGRDGSSDQTRARRALPPRRAARPEGLQGARPPRGDAPRERNFDRSEGRASGPRTPRGEGGANRPRARARRAARPPGFKGARPARGEGAPRERKFESGEGRSSGPRPPRSEGGKRFDGPRKPGGPPASLVGQAGQAAESLAANRLRAARAVLVKSCAL